MRASVRCNGVELIYGGEENEWLLSRSIPSGAVRE
jgi:hypothetical protein